MERPKAPSVQELEEIVHLFNKYKENNRTNYDELFFMADQAYILLRQILACHNSNVPNYNARIDAINKELHLTRILLDDVRSYEPIINHRGGADYCALCGGKTEAIYNTVQHKFDCVWRRADEYMAEHYQKEREKIT